MRCFLLRLLCVGLGLWAILPSHADATFQGIGDLPGGNTTSRAFAISDDGQVVAGVSSSGTLNVEAFRWTQAGGIIGLGDLAGGAAGSGAYGISGDGTTIVGMANTGDFIPLFGGEAFRWTQADGMVSLGYLPGGSATAGAHAASNDGSVIVGFSDIGSSNEEAFRWTQVGGIVGLGHLPGGGSESGAFDITADGTVIVGYSDIAGAGSFEAFRWTQAGGMVGLGDLPGGAVFSQALGVSDDGNTVIGRSVATAGLEAFRWTQAGGMVGLGDLADGSYQSAALGVSADGSIIVGFGSSAAGVEAFVWNAGDGMITLEQWLNNAGVTVSNFNALRAAEDITPDGTTVVGYGVNTSGDDEAFIARVSSLGSGIYDPLSTSQSVAALRGVESLDLHKTLMVLHGAHHRPLMLLHPDPAHRCAWLNVDGAMLDHDQGGYAANQEVGGCTSFYDNRLYVGAGIGLHQAEQDVMLGGRQQARGQYAVAQVNYSPNHQAVIFSGTGLYRQAKADIRRGYRNAGNADSSQGSTGIETLAFKGAIEMPHLLRFGMVSLSPRASYTIASAKIAGYTEQGGGFPVQVATRRNTVQQVRVGIDVNAALTDTLILRGLVQAVHQFAANGSVLQGQVLGLSSFSQDNAAQATHWARFGLEMEYAITPYTTLLASSFTANNGADADLSGALRLNLAY